MTSRSSNPLPDSDDRRPWVVAFDFGGTKMDVALVDPDGTIVHRRRLGTEPDDGAVKAVGRAAATAREFITSSAALHAEYVISAVTPGIVYDDHIDFAPNVPGWGELALGATLADLLDSDIALVENDVTAAAMAEYHAGALQGTDPGLYVGVGTGIKATLIVGGLAVQGAHRAAGEIGYAMLSRSDRDGVSQGRAPFEDIVGGAGISRRASRLLGETVTAANLFGRTDVPSRLLQAETVSVLAHHLANTVVFADPEKVVLGGGLMGSGELILAALHSRFREVAPFPPEVAAAHFTQDAALHGAIQIGLAKSRPAGPSTTRVSPAAPTTHQTEMEPAQ